MEPIVTIEGYKVPQNPVESRNLLGAYRENIGFNVVISGVAFPVKKKDDTTPVQSVK